MQTIKAADLQVEFNADGGFVVLFIVAVLIIWLWLLLVLLYMQKAEQK